MDILQAILLGLLQGATEFIPVSSSGHLVLVPWLLGWSSPGLLFDTVVHWGTLVAVLVYFWRDWRTLIGAWFDGLRRWDWTKKDARLMWIIMLGSLPAAAIGFLLEEFFESLFARPVWVSLFLLGTAALLVLGELIGKRTRGIEGLGWRDALIIGFGQAVAIAPGVSRSGATIAVGLFRGFRRPVAARFSFLLATPIILGAGLFKLLEMASTPNALAQIPVLLVGFSAAALCGYLCIWLLLRYLERGSLYVFAAYCALLGVFCLCVAWLR